MCTLFDNSTFRQACDVFVDEEYERLMEFLVAGLPPNILCTLMTACTYPLPPINGVCDVCVIAFSFLEDLWSYGPSEHVLEFALDYVCVIFPEGTARKDCDVLMNRELENVIALLDTEEPPVKICE